MSEMRGTPVMRDVNSNADRSGLFVDGSSILMLHRGRGFAIEGLGPADLFAVAQTCIEAANELEKDWRRAGVDVANALAKIGATVGSA
ncbi:hypothetical protein FHS85_004922 [Rhodoligotrophos appendicifer]|uniref:hypothetical protein n=1 Tax=Rhodoligotrophos appendicifer TaxID=987056 RepID=UPI001185EC5D|nr:hypothetical protein [Rhodoligotrophos appendicifer]